MYQANPHSANDKFSALDNIPLSGQNANTNTFGGVEKKPFVPMAGTTMGGDGMGSMSGMGNGMGGNNGMGGMGGNNGMSGMGGGMNNMGGMGGMGQMNSGMGQMNNGMGAMNNGMGGMGGGMAFTPPQFGQPAQQQ
jgi:X-X-X-Leu-X-X-Gly heptad repeat protein